MATCTVDPKDIDMEYPIADTPFYAWLKEHDIPYFEEAVRTYLKIGLRPRPSNMTNRDVNCMRCTHMHFYWVKQQENYDETQLSTI